jgi:hypothetical protein
MNEGINKDTSKAKSDIAYLSEGMQDKTFTYPKVTNNPTNSRSASCISALTFGNAVTDTATVTTTIGTIGNPSILQEWCLTTTAYGTAFGDSWSFRLDIVRGSNVVFSKRVMYGPVANQVGNVEKSAWGNSNVVLETGDKIQLVQLRNWNSVTFQAFVACTCQPYLQ